MLTAEMIDKLDLEKSFAFYKDRFADAGDFTFVFVGSFQPERMRPLVEQYLASLPALRRNETWKDVGIRPPAGRLEKTVKKGIEPKSRAAVVFSGPFRYDRDHRVAIRAMSMVLETRLREVMREDLGGTYGVSVSPGYQQIPRPEYRFAIQFGCSPQRTEELLKAVFEEIEALKTKGPSEKQVADVREALIRDFETTSKQNPYLLTQIYLRYQVPGDLGEYFGLAEYYRTLNAGMIRDAAREYLNLENHVRVTLVPQGPDGAETVRKEPEDAPEIVPRPAA
jgi:zinc protease